MQHQLKELIQKEKNVESVYLARLYQACSRCEHCPSTSLSAEATFCQYCAKYQSVSTTGLATLDLSVLKVIQHLTCGLRDELQKKVQALVQNKVRELQRLKSKILESMCSAYMEGLDLAESLVSVKLRLAQGEDRIKCLLELKSINQELGHRLSSKQEVERVERLHQRLEAEFSKIGSIIESVNQIYFKGEDQPCKQNEYVKKGITDLKQFKLILKQTYLNVGQIIAAAKRKDGRILFGCVDGLWQLDESGRKLILGGGSVLALSSDEEGSVYGTSGIQGFQIFRVEQDLKITSIANGIKVGNYGLAVTKDKIYFTQSQEESYKISSVSKGIVTELCSRNKKEGPIYSLALVGCQLLVGQSKHVSLLKYKKIVPVLANAVGIQFQDIVSQCTFRNLVFSADCSNRRIVVSRFQNEQSVQTVALTVQGAQLNDIRGVFIDGNQLYICDLENKQLVVAQILF